MSAQLHAATCVAHAHRQRSHLPSLPAAARGEEFVLLEHENIAKVSLVDVDLVEEAVEGCSLSEILDSLPGLENKYILALTRQLLEGLEFMHASGHVHGCLDPDNIIIEASTGTVKMCHRCCSAACPEDVPANNPSTDDGGFSDVASTPYMAPEVVRDDETVSAASDIWSIGCILILLFSGSAPWTPPPPDAKVSPALLVAHGHHPPIPPGIPMSAFELIASCLAALPEHRPTARDLLLHPFLDVSNSASSLPDAFDDIPLLSSPACSASPTRPYTVPALLSIPGKVTFRKPGAGGGSPLSISRAKLERSPRLLMEGDHPAKRAARRGSEGNVACE